MGQSKPLRASALIVEDDPMQREILCLLLEESKVDVIECESAEAAKLVLERAGDSLVLMMTDVQLAGHMSGVELAHIARKYNPDMGLIVTSGRPLREELPDGAKFWENPWAPLDVIREAERAACARGIDDGGGLCKNTVAEFEGREFLHGAMKARHCPVRDFRRDSLRIILCIPIHKNLALQ